MSRTEAAAERLIAALTKSTYTKHTVSRKGRRPGPLPSMETGPLEGKNEMLLPTVRVDGVDVGEVHASGVFAHENLLVIKGSKTTVVVPDTSTWTIIPAAGSEILQPPADE